VYVAEAALYVNQILASDKELRCVNSCFWRKQEGCRRECGLLMSVWRDALVSGGINRCYRSDEREMTKRERSCNAGRFHTAGLGNRRLLIHDREER
jgi:hypothetical protein